MVRRRVRRRVRVGMVGLAVAAVAISTVAVSAGSAQAGSTWGGEPNLGPNVLVFDPSMSTSDIQTAVDAVEAQQIDNQFGSQRYELLFKPGTYGSATDPLNFQVGYYTAVAGLGLSPNDVVINGSVDVYNQCDATGNCIALNNFWRSLENLTINVTKLDAGCQSAEFWAVSQAAPMRRVNVHGPATLMDYCTGPSYASGGFIADSQFDTTIVSGSQQQWVTRNSVINGWSNGVWNQVFSGVSGAPAECFPVQTSCGGPYTTLATSPVTREAPFLYVDAKGAWKVFVPAVQRNSSGVTWANGSEAGRSIRLRDFMIATPSSSVRQINRALSNGQNLLLTPGSYALDQAIKVTRKDTVVLGLGFATLTPQRGTAAMTVGDVTGVDISGLILDAGPVTSPVLLQVGPRWARKGSAGDPTALQDVFFRIGGAAAGSARVSLEVNSANTILDDIWAWRADHGNGVGWTVNTADTGLVVNGDHVTAYGLFVEHYQKTEVKWRGNGGTVVFFQNEMPYDPPSQAAWTRPNGVLGYPALSVSGSVRSFHGYGMGSYSFFNQGVDIFSANAFEVPKRLPAGSLHNLLTIFLDATNGSGGINNVVNGTGGSSTAANPDTPVTVVNYP